MPILPFLALFFMALKGIIYTIALRLASKRTAFSTKTQSI